MRRSAGLLAASLALAAAACDRVAELSLHWQASACETTLEAGTSVVLEIEAREGTQLKSCRRCVDVPTALSGADAVRAFLQRNLPSCSGIAPRTELSVRATASPSACAGDAAPSASTASYCWSSFPTTLPDGRRDSDITVSLQCNPGCNPDMGCVPITECPPEACEPVPGGDGCGGTLACPPAGKAPCPASQCDHQTHLCRH